MSGRTYYLQRDLIDYADIDTVDWVSVQGREQAVKAALPERSEVVFKRSGGYQGYYAFVVLLDGFLWVDTGSYGSCAHCDEYIGHEKEEIQRLLWDAYCFDNINDLAMWISETEVLEMTYGDARQQLQDILDELDINITDVSRGY
jgi:hypothetical protein